MFDYHIHYKVKVHDYKNERINLILQNCTRIHYLSPLTNDMVYM